MLKKNFIKNMIFKNIIIILVYIKIINCININIVNYDIFPLLFQANINNNINNSFRFCIDTGSPYTFVSGMKNNYHKHYELKNNDRFKLIKNNINITFNGNDNVIFSLYNFDFIYNNFSINNIPIGITNHEYGYYSENTIFDGFLGLGGFSGNRTIIESYINNMITYFMVEQKIIKNNIFSLYINTTNTNYNILNMYGGEIIFGDINKKYNKKIKWYNIYNKDSIYYFWNLKLNKILINNIPIIINDKISIDSGTSDIVFNKILCDELHKQINGKYNEKQQRYIIDDFHNLRNITINLNGDDYILEPNDYTFVFNDTIYSRIIINNNNKVLGLPFLQKYYSVYDFENKKIGLAKTK